MEPTIVIFLAGSAAAFLPIYWLLENGVELVSRWIGQRALPSGRSSRSAFLLCLRGEAAARASDELDLALLEMRQAILHSGLRFAPLSPQRKEGLRDVRGMLKLLFPRATIASFDQIVEQLKAGETGHFDQISLRIRELRSRLENRREADRAGQTLQEGGRQHVVLRCREPALASS
jgi:hypothetical protein